MAKKTEAAKNGGQRTRQTQSQSRSNRRPAEQALEVVDRTVGTVRTVVDQWGKPEVRERGADVRRQVTDQVVDRARKARQRVEPVENAYKQRLEPVVRDRVEPVYRGRVESTVRRVRERI